MAALRTGVFRDIYCNHHLSVATDLVDIELMRRQLNLAARSTIAT